MWKVYLVEFLHSKKEAQKLLNGTFSLDLFDEV